MKTKYPSIFGVLAIFMLVASLVVPANLASPTTAEAGFDAGICKWDTLEMPNSQVGRWDILAQSEIDKLVVAPDDNTLLSAVSLNGTTYGWGGNPVLMVGSMKGINWDYNQQVHLVSDMDRKYPNIPAPGATGGMHSVFDVACAPDDANFWAVVTSGNQTDANYVDGWANAPVEVWITEDAGANWECTNLAVSTSVGTGSAYIGCLDISPDYGGKRDIAVGMREGTGLLPFSIWVLPSTGFAGWNQQTTPTGAGNADIIDLKFSPTYVGDAAMAVVYADTGTWYNVALRDLANNDISSWVFGNNQIQVCDTTLGTSNAAGAIITADLELPSDFSGQSASLRRAYVSTYGTNAEAGDDGIFRMDDTTVYTLMDCGAAANKNIATIAYYGTYASGKLLAGEVEGDSCAATVPTWFTDSPTTCPIPCWYPALKPTTGAAALGCADTSYGNAQVAWSVTGELAYVATGSVVLDGDAGWWEAFFAEHVYLGWGTPYDETAFAISRNNGETWNQLGMIDTKITKFNDVAPSADCKTIYLASLNNLDATGLSEALGTEYTKCLGFDSVWRTSVNSAVTSPLLGILPLGFYYERVYCRPTAPSCTFAQTNLPLLRLAPAPDDEDGEIVFWAAQDPTDVTVDFTSGVAAWSPDFGDYWANINPRNPVQDFAAASNTLLYVLSPAGMVQKMPYTGTAWSSIEKDVYSGDVGHMIAVYGEDAVLVGYDVDATYPGSISLDSGAAFNTLFALLPTDGNAHVAFHPDYADNGIFFLADDNDTGANRGSVYRNTYIGLLGNSWSDGDMMAISNTAYGCPDLQAHNFGQFGLQLATTGADGDYALYSAHGAGTVPDLVAPIIEEGIPVYSAVERTLWPLMGLPKPGMFWDCLNQNLPTAVLFTLEPWSLKKCGCLTADTDTKLWALDDAAYMPAWAGTAAGYLWGFADCVAKAGPALITEDGMLIGCDVVSGRAQEVDLRWEQLCVASQYDIEIGKDANFTIKVIDWCEFTACSGFFAPEVTLAPAAYIPAGGLATYGAASDIATYGNLECGHTYYWKVEVRKCATGQIIRSPWSEVRSFTVKAGLPVSADYYGLKLLAPDNGCIGCPVSPASFSWSPFKDTTKYKFVLAKDAALTDVLAEAETATTAYEYDGTLDYSTNYFWRVMCVEPAPSDWSATFSFQTEAAPAAPEAPPEAPATPAWVWIIIALGAILVIVTLVLIFKTRRV